MHRKKSNWFCANSKESTLTSTMTHSANTVQSSWAVSFIVNNAINRIIKSLYLWFGIHSTPLINCKWVLPLQKYQDPYIYTNTPYSSIQPTFGLIIPNEIVKHNQGCARFPDFSEHFSERQILWSLGSVVFHASILKLPIQTSLSLVPKLPFVYVQVKNVENSAKWAYPWTVMSDCKWNSYS